MKEGIIMSPLLGILGLGPQEIALILVIGVLLFGRKLPEVGRYLGKGIVEFKKGIKGLEDDVDRGRRAAPGPAGPRAARVRRSAWRRRRRSSRTAPDNVTPPPKADLRRPVPMCRNRRTGASVGRLTQRLECHPHTVEVTGSNPVPPTHSSSDCSPVRLAMRASIREPIPSSSWNANPNTRRASVGGLWVMPAPVPVVSKAKSTCCSASACSRSSMIRPASMLRSLRQEWKNPHVHLTPPFPRTTFSTRRLERCP